MIKKAKKYEVKIHHSGFCTYEVFAENELEAILKARSFPLNPKDLLQTVENWEEADTATIIQNEKSKL